MNTKNSQMVQVELVMSDSSKCIATNDFRVTSGKLWGFGKTVACCHVNKDRLRKLIEGREYVDICVIDDGRKGIWIDGVNISRVGKKSDYKSDAKRWSWKVATKEIEYAMNQEYEYVPTKPKHNYE